MNYFSHEKNFISLNFIKKFLYWLSISSNSLLSHFKMLSFLIHASRYINHRHSTMYKQMNRNILVAKYLMSLISIDLLMRFVFDSFLQTNSQSFVSFCVVSHLPKNFLMVSNVMLSSEGVSDGILKSQSAFVYLMSSKHLCHV